MISLLQKLAATAFGLLVLASCGTMTARGGYAPSGSCSEGMSGAQRQLDAWATSRLREGASSILGVEERRVLSTADEMITRARDQDLGLNARMQCFAVGLRLVGVIAQADLQLRYVEWIGRVSREAVDLCRGEGSFDCREIRAWYEISPALSALVTLERLPAARLVGDELAMARLAHTEFGYSFQSWREIDVYRQRVACRYTAVPHRQEAVDLANETLAMVASRLLRREFEDSRQARGAVLDYCRQRGLMSEYPSRMS